VFRLAEIAAVTVVQTFMEAMSAVDVIFKMIEWYKFT